VDAQPAAVGRISWSLGLPGPVRACPRFSVTDPRGIVECTTETHVCQAGNYT